MLDIRVLIVVVMVAQSPLAVTSSLWMLRRQLALMACGEVSPDLRQDCGFTTVSAEKCLARGCCWEPCRDCELAVPWCYHAPRAYLDECVDTPCGEREACGRQGITWEECIKQQCCWAPNSEPDTPWCFTRPGKKTNMTTSIPETPEMVTTESTTSTTETTTTMTTTTSTTTTTMTTTTQEIPTTIPPFQVRLVGGFTRFEGRVEIGYEGRWGGLCGRKWTLFDGNVVCRQLGYGHAIRAVTGAYFKQSSMSWAKDPVCYGSEGQLSDCRFSQFGEDVSCAANETINVYCELPSDLPHIGYVRLRGSRYSNQGRVEIYHDGQWGTVCHDGWDLTDAHVVCNQLGYPGAYRYTIRSSFGRGTGKTWLSNVQCVGHEPLLFQCGHSGWGTNRCTHSEDAGVVCNDKPTNWPTLRLVGGSARTNGRVEVYHEGRWGTVCGRHFTEQDAIVVCKALGFKSVEDIKYNTEFGEGYGPVWLHRVDCYGDEKKFEYCGHFPWATGDCWHDEDVGVSCSAVSTNGTEPLPTPTRKPTNTTHENEGPSGDRGHMKVRLMGGYTRYEGRVELLHGGQWKSLCGKSSGWNNMAGNVVCRQLGYGRAIHSLNGTKFGENVDHVFAGQLSHCYGSEGFLDECTINYFGLKDQQCQNGDTIYVYCKLSSQVAESGYVRLRGSRYSNQGRVEVYHKGQWGTVCHDGWDLTDANVVCNQLGYPGAYRYTIRSSFGRGTGTIWLSNQHCTGYETLLFQCNSQGWGTNRCTHSEDAGVVCNEKPSAFAQLRLVGKDNESGRVEMYYDGRWGTVCGRHFSYQDAIVVCKQLGFNYVVDIKTKAEFGEGNGPIWFHRVDCYGDEEELKYCGHLPWGTGDCWHDEDAGVICSDGEGNSTTGAPPGLTTIETGTQPTPTDEGHIKVRLMGGYTRYEGRVEVLKNGLWGGICSNGFTRAAGNVVCRQLGQGLAVRTMKGTKFGESSSGKFWIQSMKCYGSEGYLDECSLEGFGMDDVACTKEDTAYVYCQLPGSLPEKGHVRLRGSSRKNQGRVEVYHKGQWGTVCHDGWDLTDAHVVCNQLGYPGAYRYTIRSTFGRGTGTIWLSNLKCTGYETLLFQCNIRGWGTNRCTHSEDAGAVCNEKPPAIPTLRLVGGKNSTEGRVEIYHEGRWGTVCDSHWGPADGRVVCRQLGHGTLERVVGQAEFGEGYGPVWQHRVDCHGDEDTLENCGLSPWGEGDCTHRQDAGVVCNAKDE